MFNWKQQQKLKPKTPKAGLSIQDIPTYDGNDAGEFRSVDDWLKVLETIFKLYKVEKNYWAAWAVTRLRGEKLKEWYVTKEDAFSLTWDAFCRFMRKKPQGG